MTKKQIKLKLIRETKEYIVRWGKETGICDGLQRSGYSIDSFISVMEIRTHLTNNFKDLFSKDNSLQSKVGYFWNLTKTGQQQRLIALDLMEAMVKSNDI